MNSRVGKSGDGKSPRRGGAAYPPTDAAMATPLLHFRERRDGDPQPGSDTKASSGPTHVAAARVTAGMVSSTELRVLRWGYGVGAGAESGADTPVLSPQKPILLQGHERSITQIKYNREGDLLFTVAKDPVSAEGRASGTVRRGPGRGASSFCQGSGWTSQGCRERGTKERPILRSRERPFRG